jgi:hypothetical protein
MEAFAAQARMDFERAAAADLAGIYPDECRNLGASMLNAFVRQGVAKALRYGIDRDQDILSYLYLAMENGETFDQDPAFAPCASILADSSLDGQAKIDLMYELLETFEE